MDNNKLCFKKYIGYLIIVVIVIILFTFFSKLITNTQTSIDSKASSTTNGKQLETSDTINAQIISPKLYGALNGQEKYKRKILAQVDESLQESTVVLGKDMMVSKDDYTWLGQGGTLYSSNKIITTKHAHPNAKDWFYTFGPDYIGNLNANYYIVYRDRMKNNTLKNVDTAMKIMDYPEDIATRPNVVFRDIDKVVEHPTLDLAVIVLKSGATQTPIPIGDSVKVGEVATLGSTRDEVWKEYSSSVIGLGKWDVSCLNNTQTENCERSNDSIMLQVRNRYDNNKLLAENSIISTPGIILHEGDCGAPIMQNDRVIGIAYGGMQIGFSKKNLFINLTLPELKAWIDAI